MKSADLRQCFLEFFNDNGHTVVHSSSLVPGNDPTLLFSNAGMVQFKEVFLGLEKRSYTRATSAQRCVRAGGKHNDLENVGYTARHHTFFEMLGNFSFGDYFKREAIGYSWQFLTEVLKIPAEKLWVTVFRDDDEAADIWLNELKIDPSRFSRCGEADNFWSMGDTGPCGPCSEIFYDHGPEIPGGPPGSPEQEGDRYIEIWNLVFMQYDRSAVGELSSLPKPSVDTGMGLERLAAVMQGVHNNYDTDLFQPLIDALLELTPNTPRDHNSLKVIVDHIRSCAFLIVDGVVPSNEGRGYVLRRIIRRAARHGHQLGLQEPFFYQLVAPLVSLMAQAYPELANAQSRIEMALKQEEEQFARTLEQGLRILEQDIKQLTGSMISGETLFKLYDTYGFPVDLTADIARERDLTIDLAGFEACMAKQRALSQQASQFAVDYGKVTSIAISSEFTGYDQLQQDTSIAALIKEGSEVNELREGEQGALILESTPFYAEAGGQVGDTGYLRTSNAVFKVMDTQKQGDACLHYGVLEEGCLQKGEQLNAQVDTKRRRAIMLNHSATHLLHAALRQELGEHVVQKGSLVEASHLRFDFSHYEAVTREQLQIIERMVNQAISANIPGNIEVMPLEQAKKSGAAALFGEKYADSVRVLSFGDFSKELCGGTHVERTGDIGVFKITSETGIAAGIRRIEALTGDAALLWLQELEQQTNSIAQALKVKPQELLDKLQQLLADNRQLAKQVDTFKLKAAGSQAEGLLAHAHLINGVSVLVTELSQTDPKELRSLLDKVKQKLGSCVVVLVAVKQDKMNVIAGISDDCIGKVPAPRELVAIICGKGGGRDNMAQGGGPRPADLKDRLAAVALQVEQALKS